MRRAGKSSHKLRTGAVATVVACLVIGITTLGSAERVSDSHGPTAGELEDALAASIHITPNAGSAAVAPDVPVVVTSDLGRLTDVSVTSSSGGVVPGTWDAGSNRWKSHGLLLYGHAYRVTATVTGAANLLAQKTATFRTLIPQNTVTASVWPTNGLTVGVGQPIVFSFNQPIPADARAGLERHLFVTAKPRVAGGWHWFNDHELHFRPKSLWRTGQRVTVLWSLYGWHAGDDVWGDGRGSSQFQIGDAHVSFADLTTFQMTVTDNGRVVATYPMSGGKPTDPTMGGTHIVLDRQSVVRMNSATNGVPVDSSDGYDELVYDDVHISDSGEYVHAAPWSTGSQGSENVSHGCINLSPEDAHAFFEFSSIGDVIVVTGGPRLPEPGDHGVMDWSTSWSEYTPTP